jgi:negative regulator of flagellin synthesis FlgM
VKINSAISSVGANEAPGKAKQTASSVRKPATAGSEQVDLSSLSASLQEASAAIADTPVIDVARVAEIKQAISEGRFQINPERIADGLLDSVRQMLARQQGQ